MLFWKIPADVPPCFPGCSGRRALGAAVRLRCAAPGRTRPRDGERLQREAPPPEEAKARCGADRSP